MMGVGRDKRIPVVYEDVDSVETLWSVGVVVRNGDLVKDGEVEDGEDIGPTLELRLMLELGLVLELRLRLWLADIAGESEEDSISVEVGLVGTLEVELIEGLEIRGDERLLVKLGIRLVLRLIVRLVKLDIGPPVVKPSTLDIGRFGVELDRLDAGGFVGLARFDMRRFVTRVGRTFGELGVDEFAVRCEICVKRSVTIETVEEEDGLDAKVVEPGTDTSGAELDAMAEVYSWTLEVIVVY